MNTWNTPEVNELAVSATANGLFDTTFETLLIHNDKKAETPKPTPTAVPTATPMPDKDNFEGNGLS